MSGVTGGKREKRYQEMEILISEESIHQRGRKTLESFQHILMVVALAWVWNSCEAFNLDVQFPIIFEDPTENPGRSTYFGYSVILHSSQRKASDIWIQIGAPRANSSFKEHRSVLEPGVSYRCPLAPPGPCKPLRLDGKGNEISSGYGARYWDLKDGAWIGASMGVQPGPHGVVVVCGPRWRNQWYYKNKETHPLGVCYWMPSNEEEKDDTGITVDNAEKMIPLLDSDRLRFSLPKWRGSVIYDFGMGEAGMSLHISSNKERSEMILGAPGMLNWRGGIILYRDVSFNEGGRSKRFAHIGTFSQLTIPSPRTMLRYKEFGYIGYQVSSGRFFKADETLYVATAPRGEHLKGSLFLFAFDAFGSQKNSNLTLKGRAIGTQCGEYFGASLAVGDLNNDGLDDIVVGAPLYADKEIGAIGFDEGRISVYLGSSTGRLHEVLRIIGNVQGARFGSAISYLGDLDFDGYGEIAIGAPEEDDGRGAVYIYPGDKITGLSKKPAQSLKARNIYPYLRGFGQSISTLPVDIDQNGCPDVAVGSYKSGHGVVFRGRPVLRWEIIPPHSIPSIPRNASAITVEDVCVTYTGEYAPETIGVWRMMELDPLHKRCNINEKPLFSEIMHLNKNKPYCETKKVMLQPGIQNYITPIEVNIWYLLPEEKEMMELKSDDESSEFKIKPILIGNKKEGHDEFCKDCPIAHGVSKISFSIPFEVECGMDNICYSDLQVEGDIPQLRQSSEKKNISFVIGSSDILELRLLVSNKKTSELAYLTHLYIELGEPAKISQMNSLCRETFQLPTLNDLFNYTKSSQNPTSNFTNFLPESYQKRDEGTYITCDLDNPMEENTEREVLLGIDMSNARGTKGMFLRAWASTSSFEKNPFDNVWELYVPFHSEADITITGATDNEIYTYYKGNKESEEIINFINIFEVNKIGPSPLEKVEIEFQIPRAITDGKGKKLISFLSIIKFETKQEEQPLICRNFKNNAYTHPRKEDHEITNTGDVYIIDNTKISMINDSTNSAKVQRNNTLFINCSSNQIQEDLYVECVTTICEAGPFLTSLTDATAYLHMKLNAKALYRVMGSRRAISIGTTGFVKVKDPPDLLQPILEKPDHVIISTLFVELLSTKPIDSWLIAISTATGLLLLLFLTHGLSKAGFFERKKKGKMEGLQQQLLADEINTNEEDHT